MKFKSVKYFLGFFLIALFFNSFLYASPDTKISRETSVVFDIGIDLNHDSDSIKVHDSIQANAPLRYIKEYTQYTVPRVDLENFDKQLEEINGPSKVKVYILLINGISLAHYNSIPDQVGNVSQIINWSNNQKGLDKYSYKDVEAEAKDIFKRIAAKEANDVHDRVVFCSLIDFEVRYGVDKGKRITLLQTLDYNFKDGEGQAYRKDLDDNLRKATWGDDPKNNLGQLITVVRQRTQVLSLKERLMAISSKSIMNGEVEKLKLELVETFDNELRSHVVLTLFGYNSSDIVYRPYPGVSDVAYNQPSKNSPTTNAFSVLENIKTDRIQSWLDYVSVTKVSTENKTILQKFIGGVNGFFQGDDFFKYVCIVAKQLKQTPDFNRRVEILRTQHEKNIIWSKSYLFSLFSEPPVGTIDYKAKLQDDGSINVKRRIAAATQISVRGNETGLIGSEWIPDTDLTFNPFDLVSFVDQSDLKLFGSDNHDAQMVVVPAIMLLYADHKKIIANVAEGAAITFDVVTILIPVTKVYTGAKTLQHIFRWIDVATKAGATADLVVRVGDLKDPKLVDVVANYNQVILYVNLGQLTLAAGKLAVKGFLSEINQPGVRENLVKLASENNTSAARMLELERVCVLEGKVVANVSKSESLLLKLNDKSFLELKQKVNQLGELSRKRFLEDFGDAGDDLLMKLQDGNLVKAWSKLDDAGVDKALRSNADNLKVIDGVKDKVDDINLKQALSNSSDPEKLIKNLGKSDQFYKGADDIKFKVEASSDHMRVKRLSKTSDAETVSSLKTKYSAGGGRNIATGKGKIGGEDINLESVSGNVTPENFSQKGNFMPPQETHYDGVLGYENHTEQKIVEYLRDKYKNDFNVGGTIEIMSERPFCDNCIDVVDQFQKEFKNITVIRVEALQ